MLSSGRVIPDTQTREVVRELTMRQNARTMVPGCWYLCTLSQLGLILGCTRSEPQDPSTPDDPVPNLIKALGEGDRKSRLEAADALEKLGAKAAAAAPALVTAARDPDERVR